MDNLNELKFIPWYAIIWRFNGMYIVKQPYEQSGNFW